MRKVHIGRLLELEGILDAEGVRCALEHQRARGGRFGRACLDLHLVSEVQLTELLGRQLELPVVYLAHRRIPPYVIPRLPRRLIRDRLVLPLEVLRTGRAMKLVVAFADPQDWRWSTRSPLRRGCRCRSCSPARTTFSAPSPLTSTDSLT